jgi:hypothetical protein
MNETCPELGLDLDKAEGGHLPRKRHRGGKKTLTADDAKEADGIAGDTLQNYRVKLVYFGVC